MSGVQTCHLPIYDEVVAQAIQGFLGDVGVRVSLEPLEYGLFRSWFFRGDRTPLYCWKMLNYPQLDAAALHSIFFYPSANMTHPLPGGATAKDRSEEHTSELQSHSFISYAV